MRAFETQRMGKFRQAEQMQDGEVISVETDTYEDGPNLNVLYALAAPDDDDDDNCSSSYQHRFHLDSSDYLRCTNECK